MPEDSHPSFEVKDKELRLVYFTLPMSLNYQRNSYSLREAATKTFLDKETRKVFLISESAKMATHDLQSKLLKYKLALQPNKHIDTWKRISQTINFNWQTLTHLFELADFDFLKL